ncbi:antibiotic biosynthesis monooxygenase [Mycoplasmopsis gallinacea]|uniref:Antibiotic biosynthesis monooxygenase n=1 Tax=Mycoplasmopsis gallinacea TaxID=29556 RepID=A0A0D5ZIP7_9BACT|nr:antibiotic biosynthesis monooxygenase [Mycoplasmopsis gallinacea]AKA49808.1 antibiotic biosynthesis monooxygenase [Mycoplasmopsis gallinacea]QIW62329.1 antibiotic biosynthesis monooxygenase [Mycoplasmopsis gallinacea]VEU58980.1 Uncharacterised protein [Mycoplasmopsis gallinacea]
MIYARATLYKVDEEKLKGFIDYLYIFAKKVCIQNTNLSFEYGLENKGDVYVIERWSTEEEYKKFIAEKEFKTELATLSKMAKNVHILYQMTTKR